MLQLLLLEFRLLLWLSRAFRGGARVCTVLQFIQIEGMLSMDDLLKECLDDLEAALRWLELPYQQRPPSCEISKCRSNLLTLKIRLTEEAKKKTPLKWLNLRTGIYNPLMRAGYQTVESISGLTPAQLLAIPRIGENYKNEILRALEKWNQEPRTPAHQGFHSEP